MGVREESVALLRSGLTPSQICREMHVSLATTLGYLEQMIGRGKLRRSDVFYSLSKDVRLAIAQVSGPTKSRNPPAVWGRLQRAGLNRVWADEALAIDDIETCHRFGDARHALQDMYEDIRSVECGLHSFIRRVLFANLDKRWWRDGVPLKIRQECVSRREEDNDSQEVEPFCYTDTIHLSDILKADWAHFQPYARHVSKAARFKGELIGAIKRMNTIRKKVMHPVRGAPVTEDEFEHLRWLRHVTEQLVASVKKTETAGK